MLEIRYTPTEVEREFGAPEACWKVDNPQDGLEPLLFVFESVLRTLSYTDNQIKDCFGDI